MGIAVANGSSLTIALPEDMEAFVRQRVASGRFASASDVVLEALTLLERRERDREQTRDLVLAEIREEIEVGARQAEAGQLRDGREVFEEIRRRRAMKP